MEEENNYSITVLQFIGKRETLTSILTFNVQDTLGTMQSETSDTSDLFC